LWQKGDVLDNKYRIEESLGEGGFGTTYKALQILSNSWVAIKTPHDYLKRDGEYEKYVQRFYQEAETLRKLTHPHIVPIRDLFILDNLPYLVIDFIAGDNLWDLVQKQGAKPEAEIVEYISQIGSALSLVHSHGLVHRDATPSNIMLAKTGEAILIDFGLVGEVSLSQVSSKAMGNPAFVPCEQWRGRRSPTVDIYTLAASCYYGVTGQVPQWNEEDELILPKVLNPQISQRLNLAISQGMALRAKDRPQTMVQWLELLFSDQLVGCGR